MTETDWDGRRMRTDDAPLISVIVPVYNAGLYLKDCIESILRQTYTKLEIILVNDGSKDDSLSVCRKYTKQDRRIIVLDQENKGRVAARKAGILTAKGEYISFVDADDWIAENMYELFFTRTQDVGKKADITAFGLIEEYGERHIIRKEKTGAGFYEKTSLIQLKEHLLCGDCFFEFGILPHLCDKIFRKEILLASGFMELDERLVYGEDAAATFRTLIKCHSLHVLDITPYHYRQNHYTDGLNTLQISQDNFRILYREFQRSIEECPDREIYERQIFYYFWFVLLLQQFETIQSVHRLIPFPQSVLGKRILLYGAGGFGVEVYKYVRKSRCCKVVGWTDRAYSAQDKKKLPLESPKIIYQRSYDYILITILNERTAELIKEKLLKNGVPLKKILYVRAGCLDKEALPEWLTEKDEKSKYCDAGL